MARETEIAEGIHVIKISVYDTSSQLSIPKPLRVSTGITSSQFLGVMALGKCIIITPVRDTSADGIGSEMRHQFELAIKAWEER
jgi:hypothetical protein